MPRPPSAGLLMGYLRAWQDTTPSQYRLAYGVLTGGQDATPSQCKLAYELLTGVARCHALPYIRMGDRQSCQTR